MVHLCFFQQRLCTVKYTFVVNDDCCTGMEKRDFMQFNSDDWKSGTDSANLHLHTGNYF